MAAGPEANISAWAVPAQVFGSILDHTYGLSSCGLQWGCFGRSSGGAQICAGAGSSAICECLSYPRAYSGEYAGLRYLIDGVCHEATNRVLDPAGLKLTSEVRGYALSVLRFGQYGLAAWNQRSRCYSIPPRRAGFADTGAKFSLVPAVPTLVDDAMRAVADLLDASGVRVDAAAISALEAAHADRLNNQKELISRSIERKSARPNFKSSRKKSTATYCSGSK
jgi:hypothetical protein